jgi:hypothetical protein
MSAPNREVIITIRREYADDAAPALQAWLAAEPLIRGIEFALPGSVSFRAWLHPLWVVDGPDAGTWANDRPRAIELLRKLIPSHLVESVIVEGRDWSEQ